MGMLLLKIHRVQFLLSVVWLKCDYTTLKFEVFRQGSRSAVEGEGAPSSPPGLFHRLPDPPINKLLPLLSNFMAIGREGTPPTHAHCLNTLERVYSG